MREQLRTRLTELQQEFEGGQSKLQGLELEVVRLREALLRISGAIQILQELLSTTEGDGQPAEAPAHADPKAGQR
jgi:predicted nuclease with TOPRIM domain